MHGESTCGRRRGGVRHWSWRADWEVGGWRVEVCSWQGVEEDGVANKGTWCSEDRQTRSDCHSAQVPKWSERAHGCQGTVLKRLAVTKRMKGGEFYSFFAAEATGERERGGGDEREREGGGGVVVVRWWRAAGKRAREGKRADGGWQMREQLSGGACWASVHACREGGGLAGRGRSRARHGAWSVEPIKPLERFRWRATASIGAVGGPPTGNLVLLISRRPARHFHAAQHGAL